MNTKNRIYILFYICFCCMSSIAQSTKQTYTNLYDLHFTMQTDSFLMYPWLENAAYVNYTFPTHVKDSSRILFARKYIKGFPFSDRLRTEYEQRIFLPVHQEKEGCVVFESKGKNIKSVSILFDGINKEEKKVFSDTLVFVPDSCLSQISKKIGLTNVELLNIRINAEGEINEEAFIAFSKVDILIGDISLDQFSFPEFSEPVLQEKKKYIPINLNSGVELQEIDDIKNGKIIAFGESVHGNASVKDLVYELTMQAIEKQNCKLVIWEMPLEKSLAYNRYIQNNDFAIDSTLSVDRKTTDFLNKLRLYNSTKIDEDKVNLFGMDYNSIYNANQNSAVDIFDFITQLNSDLKISEIDQLAVLLMDKDWSKAITFLITHKNKVQELLTSSEVECMIHILNLSKKVGTDNIQRCIDRDSVMFINTTFLINKFATTKNAKTVVYGHAAHINPISTFPVVPCTSLGSYMQKLYSTDYRPLLFLTGNGGAMAYDAEYNRKDNFLENTPIGSMEYFLSSFDSEVFYFPLTSDFNRLILSRFKGSHHIIQEFYLFNLFQRYNGVFFIKNSYQQNKEEKELLFEEATNKFIFKNKQRQKVLSEIQKRI